MQKTPLIYVIPAMTMTLQGLVTAYAAATDVQPVTIAQYERSVRYFSNFVGHEATTADLAEMRVNLWVKSMQERGYDPVTVKNYLIGLLTIWNYAASEDCCEEYRRTKIRRPKMPEKIIEAWDSSQVASLETAAREIAGTLHNGCQASIYMTALVMVASDTMLRPGDMRKIKWTDLQNGVVRLVQSKTGRQVVRSLRPATVAAVEALRRFSSISEKIFWLSKGGQRVHEDKVRKLADLWQKGRALGKLRHAGATKIAESKDISAAGHALGHAPGSVVAAKFYVARRETGPAPWADEA